MENGQEETKTEGTNNVAEQVVDEVADKVKNATPIADDTNDVKDEDEGKKENDAKGEDDLKEEKDIKEGNDIKEENDGKKENDIKEKNDEKEETDIKKETDIKGDDAKEGNDVKENDVKEDEPSAELKEKIKEQVEYYFGNVNMQKDKFLIEQTKLDDGWIPMSIMLNFKQLTNLSKSANVILKALEASDLMEISEDRKKIRRSPNHPLPEYNEEYRKAQEHRTIYVKGFPQTDITIEKLKVFLAPYKPFETIVMRKYQDKEKNLKFKGSIFVQFETVEVAKAFMDVESIKFNDVRLIRKWAMEYATEKAQQREDRRKKKPDNKSKKASGVEQKESDEEMESTPATEIKLPRGSVIHFSGVCKTCVREDIKERLEQLNAEIAYIDFQRGDEKGWIRLQGENAAKPVVDKMEEGKIKIQDFYVTCKVLEGKEEEEYLIKVTEDMMAAKNKHNKGKRGGKKGRNARGGKKRGSSPGRDAVPAKKGKASE